MTNESKKNNQSQLNMAGNPLETFDLSFLGKQKTLGNFNDRQRPISPDGVTLEAVCDEEGTLLRAHLYIGSNAYNGLKKPPSVQIAFMEDVILLGKELPVKASRHNLTKRGNHKQIQKRDFVKEIFEIYGFKIESTRIAFDDIEYKLHDGNVIAIVKVPKITDDSES